MIYQGKNLIGAELADGNINSSQTTLPLDTGLGARFPSTASAQYELVIWNKSYGSPLEAYQNSAAEVVLVTSHDGSSDTIATITRAQGGTSAVDFSSFGTCEAILDFTKTLYDDLNERQIIPHDTTSGTLWSGHGSRKLYYPDFPLYQFDATTEAYANGGANRYEIHWWVPPRSGRVDELFIAATATGQTATCRLAIYDTTSLTSLYPGALLYDSGALSASSLGSTATARWVCDPSGSVTFKQGKGCFLGMWFDASVTLNGISNTGGQFVPLIGYDWQNVSTLNKLAAYNDTDAGIGSGWPDPFTPGVAFSNNLNNPIFWMHWES